MVCKSIAVYVHIPFCAKHCAYCDFNTYVEKRSNQVVQLTVDAICRDIELSAVAGEDRVVETIFFGGGTPTFLSTEQIVSIFSAIRGAFAISEHAEISSEANPGSSDAEKFSAMYQAGFNRLSIGVQSFDDGLLAALDRFHSSAEARGAYNCAREAGFANINLDLMFGLPRQQIDQWTRTLDLAASLNAEHLSLYALTLEPGTRFERMNSGGKLLLPDEDTELEMYELSIAALQRAGYEHYEVSNFAKPGFRCKHNQFYWRNEEYLGFGPGSVSYLAGKRYKKERLPSRYAAKLNTGKDIVVESETLDEAGAVGETMMLGLRLRDGIDVTRIAERFGIDPLSYYAKLIERLRYAGYLEVNGSVLRLTHAGMLIANNVLADFLSD